MGCPYRDEDMGHRGGPEGSPIGLIMAPNGVPNGVPNGSISAGKGVLGIFRNPPEVKHVF